MKNYKIHLSYVTDYSVKINTLDLKLPLNLSEEEIVDEVNKILENNEWELNLPRGRSSLDYDEIDIEEI